jgi:hypothetical protein
MVRPLVGHLRAHQKADLNGDLDWTRRLSQVHRMTPGARPQSPAGGASKDNSSGPSASYFSNDCCIASWSFRALIRTLRARCWRRR